MFHHKNRKGLLLIFVFSLVTVFALGTGFGRQPVQALPTSGTYFAAEDSPCTDPNVNESNCGIIHYLVLFVRVLSALVGVVVVIMITVGGIQYSSARDNPQAAAAAKNRITNAILALVAYLFMFSFLQWLIPGGVL